MAASMTGEQIQAFAYQLEPLAPKGLAPAVEFVAIILGIISVIVVSLRIYVRAGLSGASSRLWGIEDYLAVIGTLPFIPAVVFAVLASRYGVGFHDADLPSQLYLIRASEYQTYWEVLYFISSTIIKCAIGFTCIRLDRRKRVVICMVLNINMEPGTTVSYIVSAIQMLTDWTCAIVPFFIVAGLQMSRRKKVSVIAILGLGIFASIATCIRMPYLKYYDTAKYPTEIAYHLGVISITSNLECSLGIIGSSLPPLRKLFKFYYGSSHDGNYKITGESGDALGSAGPGIKLGSLSGNDRTYHASAKRGTSRAGTREHETDDDDSSSRKGIIRKTDIHVSTSTFHV
ncbi:hypothetical protein COL516b_010750 [Colletotrichum fioriniae]|nr:uncharacterized protein COL516b_010750 [Colletotrichum fioriniae]KAJ0297333.1 hypothetical protein COL516b_010750 [Colletotrichum fioriniae]